MKTKVVAFRVSENEHAALVYAAKTVGKKLSEFVDDAMMVTITDAVMAYQKEQKRLEAKAKRDAKKAAAQ